jgi:hypothetical protein
MKKFKKWLSISLTAFVLGTAVVYPIQRAEAVVGLATLNPVMALIGLGTIGAGEGLLWCGWVCDNFDENGIINGIMAGAGILGTVGGLVLLDGSNGQDVAFSPIHSQTLATQIGLSQTELVAYNRQIDAINLIRENVASQLPRDPEHGVQDAASLWEKYRSDLSSAAFSAAQKVSRAATRALQSKLRSR